MLVVTAKAAVSLYLSSKVKQLCKLDLMMQENTYYWTDVTVDQWY